MFIPFNFEMNGKWNIDTDLMALFIEHKVNINEGDLNRNTPLMWAAHIGHEECVKLILDAALKRDLALFEQSATQCFRDLPEGACKQKMRKNLMLLFMIKKRNGSLLQRLNVAKLILMEIRKLSIENPLSLLKEILEAKNEEGQTALSDERTTNEEIKQMLREYQEMLPKNN